MSKMIIVEGNFNYKDNVRAIMVKGEKGYSAYDLYVKNGGTLTEEEWLDAFLNAENYYNKSETDKKLNKKPYHYNTVADMKSDNSLKQGDMAVTLGYYSVNDGGNATYRIVNNTSTTDFQETLGNGKYASLVIESGEVNVNQCGVIGDNETDVLNKLQSINDFFENSTICIPKGTYLISNTLYISNNNNLLMSEDATIKAIANMDYLLIYNKENIPIVADRSLKKFITGGVLNGDYKVNESILSLQGVVGFTVSNTKILNFNKYGIKTKIDSTGVNEAIFDNIYIKNDRAVIDSIGIYNNANDCKFSNIIIRDTHKGILTITGFFEYIHGWIGLAELIPDSYFLKTKNNLVICNEMYADTYQYAFISTFGSLNISNSLILNNDNVYTSALQSTNKPILFKSELDEFNLNTYGYFKVINSQINTSDFDEVELTNRYNANNIFEYNYFTNYNNIINKNYFNYSTNKGAFSGSADNLFVNGNYSVSNNAGLPGSFLYGVLKVTSTVTTNGAYLTNNDTTYLSYTEQEFITSETVPKKYFRIYTKSSGWTSWEKITTTTMS